MWCRKNANSSAIILHGISSESAAKGGYLEEPLETPVMLRSGAYTYTTLYEGWVGEPLYFIVVLMYHPRGNEMEEEF